MSKKLLAIILVAVAGSAAALVGGCSTKGNTEKPDDGEEHLTHEYNLQVAEDKFLRAAATCTKSAEYYLSCSCGEAGSETFFYGKPLGHNFDGGVYCSACGVHKPSEGLTFTLSEDRASYSLSGMGDCTDVDVFVPDYYGEDMLPVKSVRYSAFSLLQNLESVTLPNTIERIYTHAFAQCYSLATVHIPDGIETIDNEAFWCNNALVIECEGKARAQGWGYNWNYGAPVVFDCENSNVADDGNIYFTEGGLRYALKDGEAHYYMQRANLGGQIVLDDTVSYRGKDYQVAYVGARAFALNTAAESISVAAGIKEIKNNAFDSSHIQRVEILAPLLSIGEEAFLDCKQLVSITLPSTLTKINTSLLRGCSALTSVTIPEGVTEIEKSAFFGCSSLDGVTLPQGLTDLGKGAFSYCSSLSAIEIPQNITSIAEYTFDHCDCLDRVKILNSCQSIDEKAFNSSVIKYATIPLAGLTPVKGGFYFPELREIEITDGVVLPERAFSSLYSLEKVTLADGFTQIKSNAFANCYRLTEVNIPSGVTSLGEYCFTSCYSLAQLEIPATVSFISGSAFSYCYHLTLYCHLSSAPTGWQKGWNRYGASTLDALRLVWNCESNFVADDGNIYAFYDNFRYRMKVDDNNNIIGAALEKQCFRLHTETELSIPASMQFNGNVYPVTEIVPSALSSGALNTTNNQFAYTKVIIPDSVKKIGTLAFSGSDNLKKIVFGQGVEELGSLAFYKSTALEEVVIDAAISKVYCDAFLGCSALKHVYYEDSYDSWWNGVTLEGNLSDFNYTSRLYYYSDTPQSYKSWHYLPDGTIEIWTNG